MRIDKDLLSYRLGCSMINSYRVAYRKLFPVITLFGSCLATCVQANDALIVEDAIAQMTLADLKRHCTTLASDAMEGREAGSNGGRAASAYLLTELRKIPSLVGAGSNGWVQEFGPNYRNVLASLPGSDEDLRREIIVIGAHYDHVGRGNQANSRGPFGYIHNGADDNASGTAALLELAKAFANLKSPPRRTVLFAFWDAEELGLIGSHHWVRSPTLPIKDVRFVMNIDMLGRLREGKLTVAGWRSAPGLRPRLARLNSANDLEFLFEPKVTAESDHYYFYTSRIPSLHFDSGKHEDYHRPTDDADKLNYEGMLRLTELVFRLVYGIAMETAPPKFRTEALTESPPSWMQQSPPIVNARLGVAFEPTEFDRNRMIVIQVTPGSAADKAGIRPGDQILKLAHWDSGTAKELKTIVQIARNPASVQLRRPSVDAPIDIRVDLAGEPVRVGIRWQPDGALPEELVITHVVKDSPADQAGIKPGDILTKIGGEAIPDEQQFRHRLLHNPNPIELQIERNGRLTNLSVDLFEPSEQSR